MTGFSHEYLLFLEEYMMTFSLIEKHVGRVVYICRLRFRFNMFLRLIKSLNLANLFEQSFCLTWMIFQASLKVAWANLHELPVFKTIINQILNLNHVLAQELTNQNLDPKSSSDVKSIVTQLVGTFRYFSNETFRFKSLFPSLSNYQNKK